MQEKIHGELISARIHAGPVLALARIQANIIQEVFPEYCAKFLREIMSGRIHAAPVFAPARIQQNIPGELFMYWFVPGGIQQVICLSEPEDACVGAGKTLVSSVLVARLCMDVCKVENGVRPECAGRVKYPLTQNDYLRKIILK